MPKHKGILLTKQLIYSNIHKENTNSKEGIKVEK